MWLFVTPWMAACQGSLSLTIFRSLPKFMFIALVMLSSPSHSVTPSSPSALNLSQLQGLFNESSLHIRWKFQLQLHSFQWMSRADLPEDWLVWSPCCPRDFQEFSPAPQFESVSSIVLCLTPEHDHWEDHSLDYTDVCQQSNIYFCFSTYYLGLSSLPCQEATIFWFHGCSHHPQWFWSPRRGNLSLLSPSKHPKMPQTVNSDKVGKPCPRI